MLQLFNSNKWTSPWQPFTSELLLLAPVVGTQMRNPECTPPWACLLLLASSLEGLISLKAGGGWRLGGGEETGERRVRGVGEVGKGGRRGGGEWWGRGGGERRGPRLGREQVGRSGQTRTERKAALRGRRSFSHRQHLDCRCRCRRRTRRAGQGAARDAAARAAGARAAGPAGHDRWARPQHPRRRPRVRSAGPVLPRLLQALAQALPPSSSSPPSPSVRLPVSFLPSFIRNNGPPEVWMGQPTLPPFPLSLFQSPKFLHVPFQEPVSFFLLESDRGTAFLFLLHSNAPLHRLQPHKFSANPLISGIQTHAAWEPGVSGKTGNLLHVASWGTGLGSLLGSGQCGLMLRVFSWRTEGRDVENKGKKLHSKGCADSCSEGPRAVSPALPLASEMILLKTMDF